MAFRIDDTVKVIGNGVSRHQYDIGMIGIIARCYKDQDAGRVRYVVKSGGRNQSLFADEIELVKSMTFVEAVKPVITEAIKGFAEDEVVYRGCPSMNTRDDDPVNHPSHYTDGKFEVIEYIEDKNFGYHLGNAVKYISRAGKKDPSKTKQDLAKAIWYINRYMNSLD